MRGSTFFNNLFNDKKSPNVVRKGRSEILVQERNELLLLRYYFYGKYSELRYNAVLIRLRNEFFLSKTRILDIVTEHQEVLKRIREEDVSLQEMRKRYPHINWSLP